MDPVRSQQSTISSSIIIIIIIITLTHYKLSRLRSESQSNMVVP
jgi:hypothetical protein